MTTIRGFVVRIRRPLTVKLRGQSKMRNKCVSRVWELGDGLSRVPAADGLAVQGKASRRTKCKAHVPGPAVCRRRGGHRFFNCAEYWDPEVTLPRIFVAGKSQQVGLGAPNISSQCHTKERGSTRPANDIGWQDQRSGPTYLNREDALSNGGYSRRLMITRFVLIAAPTLTALPYRRRLMMISALRNIKLRGLSRPSLASHQ